MQYGAKKVYYHFDADGRLQGAEHRPANVRTRAVGIAPGGYWYERDGKILMFWSKTGTFNELILSASGDSLSRVASADHAGISGTKFR